MVIKLEKTQEFFLELKRMSSKEDGILETPTNIETLMDI